MKVVHKELYIGSYRIVSFNRDYNSEDKCDDSEDEQDIDNSKLTCLYNITRYRSHRTLLSLALWFCVVTIWQVSTILPRTCFVRAPSMGFSSCVVFHIAIVINSCQWVRER